MTGRPGPWRLEPNHDRDDLLDLRDREGFLIGTMSPHGMPEEVRRQICAAPEMLDLLREFSGRWYADDMADLQKRVAALLKRIDGEG